MNTASHVTIAAAGVHARAIDAWTAFWADAGQSRCAAAAPAIWHVLSTHWASFSRRLEPDTPVLDLGCGACVVGRLLAGLRTDLHVTGIDSALIPAVTHPRLAVLSHTAMESLPFPDRRFGAVVSQFGFEYSRTDAAARQIARVLAPGGKLSLLVHHAGSAIVAATRARSNAVDVFLGPAIRGAFCAEDAAGFDAQMRALAARFSGDALISLLARTLPQRSRDARDRRTAIWAAIEEALAPERCVSQALNACCVSPSQLDGWLEPLRGACHLDSVAVLREPNGSPVAWRIEGVRAH